MATGDDILGVIFATASCIGGNANGKVNIEKRSGSEIFLMRMEREYLIINKSYYYIKGM